MSSRGWILAGAVAAVAHPLAEHLGAPLPLSVAVKAAATAALLAAALAGGGSRDSARRRLAIGLGCHLLGDVLIETAPLPAAMAAFLVGHLVYLSLFLRWRARWRALPAPRFLLMAALIADATALGATVVPKAGELAVAVAVYAAALLAMALAAALAEAPALLPAGAALYVLSDSLLSWHLFVAPLPTASLLVWPTYWLGQALITAGVLRHPDSVA